MSKKKATPRSGRLKHHAILILHKMADLCVIVGLLWLLSICYGVAFKPPYFILAILTCSVVPVLFGFARVYASHGLDPDTQFFRCFQGWGLVIITLVLLGFATKTTDIFSRLLLGTWFVLTPFVLCWTQLGLTLFFQRIGLSNGNRRRAVIAGTGEMAVRLRDQLNASRAMGIDVLGFFTATLNSGDQTFEQRPLFGTFDQLPGYVRRERLDIVYITLSQPEDEPEAQQLINALQDTTACVYCLSKVLPVETRQVRVLDVNGIGLVACQELPFSGVQALLKRALDISLSALLLFLITPIMVGIAITVKLSSPGPAIFKQRRYGLKGEEILVYKFRTMRVTEDSGHIKQAQAHDPRITPVGAVLRRTSLDELPQFINVLQGTMSIVGPRPHAVAHNEYYRKLIQGYMVRHMVKPGITGWAQINGWRGETETLEKMQKRVEFDLYYLHNWSLWLDLKIILRTVLVLFGHQNAY